MNPAVARQASGRSAAARGARPALVLLLLINLFNYVDRQVLAAVVPSIEKSFFGGGEKSAALEALQNWCRAHLGFQPELALIGVLSMAFMVTVHGRRAALRPAGRAPLALGARGHRRRSSGAWRAAPRAWPRRSSALLLTRCLVGIGEAAYGPVAPTILSDLYPVEHRGRILAWFYMAIPVGSALGYVLGGAVADSSIGALGRAPGGNPRRELALGLLPRGPARASCSEPGPSS